MISKYDEIDMKNIYVIDTLFTKLQMRTYAICKIVMIQNLILHKHPRSTILLLQMENSWIINIFFIYYIYNILYKWNNIRNFEKLFSNQYVQYRYVQNFCNVYSLTYLNSNKKEMIYTKCTSLARVILFIVLSRIVRSRIARKFSNCFWDRPFWSHFLVVIAFNNSVAKKGDGKGGEVLGDRNEVF